MSNQATLLGPDAVTRGPGQAPFILKPLIEDILRTRYCIPGSIFLVEGIEAAPVSRTGRWQAIRLLLGDGEMCVQALLSGAMHPFVETGEVFVGSYVRAESFDVKVRDVSNLAEGQEQAGQMVYLVLQDAVTIGRNDSYRAMWLRSDERQYKDKLEVEDIYHALSDEEKVDVGGDGESRPNAKQVLEAGHRDDTAQDDDDDDADMEDAFETFEALVFPSKKPKSPLAPETPHPQAEPSTSPSKPAASSRAPLPIALPRDWHNPQKPLKLTTLRSIPHLPYAQNWSCNVLAIIASLSPVEPSHLPPYKQRTARIADPSTAKQVHLTVFLDPEGFEPAVGSAVLLVGVKNHRFDGGSLKKYASDGGSAGTGRWWFEEPSELGWCDVYGIKQWWAQAQGSTHTPGHGNN